MYHHITEIKLGGIIFVGTLLQIDGILSVSDLLDFERIGTVGILVFFLYYFRNELKATKAEYLEEIKQKDSQIEKLNEEIKQLLKTKKDE
jgi:hypothetical protein